MTKDPFQSLPKRTIWKYMPPVFRWLLIYGVLLLLLAAPLTVLAAIGDPSSRTAIGIYLSFLGTCIMLCVTWHRGQKAAAKLIVRKPHSHDGCDVQIRS